MVRRHVLVAALLMAAAIPLHAQSISHEAGTPTATLTADMPSQAQPAPTAQPASVEPSSAAMGSLSVAARTPTSAPSFEMAPANRAGLGPDRAMMIVGVAAILAGAVVGGTPGTVIMIGGAVVGLVGLYGYLQ